MRDITEKKDVKKNAASTKTMGRFVTGMLTLAENRKALARINSKWLDRAMAKTKHRRVILDPDSSESQVFGEQEGSAKTVISVVYAFILCFVSTISKIAKERCFDPAMYTAPTAGRSL